MLMLHKSCFFIDALEADLNDIISIMLFTNVRWAFMKSHKCRRNMKKIVIESKQYPRKTVTV